MTNKTYYVSKTRKKKDVMFLEYDNMDGYHVKPKVNKDDSIEVSKIVFVNPEMSEKIIRKKIELKINYLLKKLKEIEEESGDNEGTIRKSLLEAERLRINIINKYIKYLGNTYGALTLKKIQIIIEELRFRLFNLEEKRQEKLYYQERESRRGR